jgi:predicted acyl esterase
MSMSHTLDSRSQARRVSSPRCYVGLLAASALSPAGALGCSGDDRSNIVPSAADEAAIEVLPATGETVGVTNSAIHLTMRDGVRIAVDVWLPEAAARGEAVPSIVRATRYWRDVQILDRGAKPETDGEVMARSFVDAGYAYLAIDARGTGSSFGVTGPSSPTSRTWLPTEASPTSRRASCG